MIRLTRGWKSPGGWVLLLAVPLLASLTACDGDEGVTDTPLPPTAVTVQAVSLADTILVSWTASEGVMGYRVDLTGGASPSRIVPAGLTSAAFTSGDGIEDGTQYTASVTALGSGVETPSENAAQVTANFFPWDEYFGTSLHRSGMGKQTFYNQVPNGGFEKFTGIPYESLACKGCHIPGAGGTVKGARGCQSCHDTDDPQLGAQVNANLTNGVCGPCHSRQKAEALVHGFQDVHRDAGMDCMACHTLGDMHGDGNAYLSMLDEGAIDSECSDCHQSLEYNVFHVAHLDDIDCTACHTQSVVTCNNCHFETEVDAHQKIPYGQFKNWTFLLNKDGKVSVGNYQSVTYQGKAVVAFGPYYAHTIVRNAVDDCTDCHRNPAVQDWAEDGVIDVVWWDAGKNDPNGKNLSYRTGIIPVPPNFFQGGMRFDFVTLDKPAGTKWSFVKTGADIYQILYATPLTEAQMNKLR